MSKKQLYYCDPLLNQECSKGAGCFLRGGSCQSTSNIKYAMTNYNGIPVMSDGQDYKEDDCDEGQLESKVQE